MTNTIEIIDDGPMRLHGEFELRDDNGQVVRARKVYTLCRCGHSARLPFCDASHETSGFSSCPRAPQGTTRFEPTSEATGAQPQCLHSETSTAMSIVKGQIMDGGPLHLVGDFEIVDALGNRFPHSGIFSLCRCGYSQSKPYCDGSHRAQRWAGCQVAAASEANETSTQK